MKRIQILLFALLIAAGMNAQTLNVVIGEVTYAIPAEDAGDMIYSDATTLTILNKVYTLADIDSMYVDASDVDENAVNVVYNGSTSAVRVDGRIAQYLTVTASGADVSIAQSDDLATELTYNLSGTSTDGSFYMSGSYKATVALNGLTLTNADGAPIDIQNGKRINLELVDGTTSSLTDCSSGSQKACFVCKGHLEVDGSGTLNIAGNTKHAMWVKEYVQLKKGAGTINITSAQNDGINCQMYYQQNGGTVTISGVGDDGIQCDVKDDDDDEDNTGEVIMKGGTLNITVTATAAKGLKSEGSMTFNDGKSTPVVNITTTGGGEWDDDDSETKASSCISSDANITIDAGTFTLKSTGAGGKGIKADSLLTINGGTISVTTTGSIYMYGNYSSQNLDNVDSKYYSSPKGIKVKGNVVINDGTITVATSGTNGEGIESKSEMYVNGGTIEISAYDDCLNSSSHMYLNGGKIYCTAEDNDGIDSNGNLYLAGSTVVAYGTSAPECGLDANEEDNYSLYFTGGVVVGVGGSQSSLPSNSSSTQAYVTYSGSVSNGTTLLLRNGSTDILAFTMGRSYSSGGGMRAPGGGNQPGGGSSGSMNMVISSPNLTKGTSYTLYSGASVSGDSWHGLYASPTVSSTGSTLSTLTAALYSSSSRR